MTVLILGGTGQVGQALQDEITRRRAKSCPMAQALQILTPTRQQLPLDDLDALQDFLTDHAPRLVINAAAYTAVDSAEDNPEKAKKLNADLPAILADFSKKTGAHSVHYSTDYVFDGKKTGLYTEKDTPQPLNVYGRTKWQGEQHLLEKECSAWVFRTSWVYSPYGSNFVRTIEKLAQKKEQLSVIHDQKGAPTSAECIAKATWHCLNRGFSKNLGTFDAQFLRQTAGLYHLTCTGLTNWFEWSKRIVQCVQDAGKLSLLQPQNIQPIWASAYAPGTILAQRPLNSGLNTEKITQTFHLNLPSWEEEWSRLAPRFFSPK